MSENNEIKSSIFEKIICTKINKFDSDNVQIETSKSDRHLLKKVLGDFYYDD